MYPIFTRHRLHIDKVCINSAKKNQSSDLYRFLSFTFMQACATVTHAVTLQCRWLMYCSQLHCFCNLFLKIPCFIFVFTHMLISDVSTKRSGPQPCVQATRSSGCSYCCLPCTSMLWLYLQVSSNQQTLTDKLNDSTNL